MNRTSGKGYITSIARRDVQNVKKVTQGSPLHSEKKIGNIVYGDRKLSRDTLEEILRNIAFLQISGPSKSYKYVISNLFSSNHTFKFLRGVYLLREIIPLQSHYSQKAYLSSYYGSVSVMPPERRI